MAKYNNIYHRNMDAGKAAFFSDVIQAPASRSIKLFTAKHSPKYARKSRMVLHCWKTACNSLVKNGNWENG